MEDARGVLQHLFERRRSTKSLNHPVLLHRAQRARIKAHLTNLLHCSFLKYRISYIDVRNKQFVDPKTATIAGEVASRASLTSPQRELVDVVALQSEAPKHTVFGRVRHATA